MKQSTGEGDEEFIKRVQLPKGVRVFTVSEDGASIYSASEVAREEFPDYDVTVRGAVSIGRRLMDPLAELVKIDPKSIGVGQYQHDMNQKKLNESLTAVVEDCVNKVGVDLNTASASLLEYISGISKTLAKNIVAYREANGRFGDRRELLKVSKLGPKAFEQCAGFMRINGGKHPLDATGVHPESYEAVLAFAEKHPDETLIVVTADHETGAVTPNGDGTYTWTSGSHSDADVPVLVYGCDSFIENGETIDNVDIPTKAVAFMTNNEVYFPTHIFTTKNKI